MKGPRPTPTRLKILRGNPGQRRLNRDEPQPDALPSDCPEELLTNPDAAREWQRAIVPAIARGHITESDRVFAIAHCELWATWRSQLAVAAQGTHVVHAGPNNYPVPNPARGMANKTLMMLTKVDSELGFSPTSRTRVKADANKTSGLTRLEREKAAYR